MRNAAANNFRRALAVFISTCTRIHTNVARARARARNRFHIAPPPAIVPEIVRAPYERFNDDDAFDGVASCLSAAARS